ncbi:SDR family oxidoreductase [Brasilonema octagenarum]|uniref:SDR family oxidoreductase n=1 Tax=Brasilonema octagenarum TaxID=417105 RepID=UPI0032B77E0C
MVRCVLDETANHYMFNLVVLLIRINAVNPGIINTDMMARITEENGDAETASQQLTTMIPMERMGKPEEETFKSVKR